MFQEEEEGRTRRKGTAPRGRRRNISEGKYSVRKSLKGRGGN
jgi:hypothetical protein